MNDDPDTCYLFLFSIRVDSAFADVFKLELEKQYILINQSNKVDGQSLNHLGLYYRKKENGVFACLTSDEDFLIQEVTPEKSVAEALHQGSKS